MDVVPAIRNPVNPHSGVRLGVKEIGSREDLCPVWASGAEEFYPGLSKIILKRNQGPFWNFAEGGGDH